MQDFKKFILRGNVVDLAVGIVIGSAFSAVVASLVKDMITPIIAAIAGKTDFSSLSFAINGSKFLYGDFLNAILSFVIIAVVVFFLIVQPLNKLTEIATRNKTTPSPTTRKCPACLGEIPIGASKCMFCTSDVPAAQQYV